LIHRDDVVVGRAGQGRRERILPAFRAGEEVADVLGRRGLDLRQFRGRGLGENAGLGGGFGRGQAQRPDVRAGDHLLEDVDAGADRGGVKRLVDLASWGLGEPAGLDVDDLAALGAQVLRLADIAVLLDVGGVGAGPEDKADVAVEPPAAGLGPPGQQGGDGVVEQDEMFLLPDAQTGQSLVHVLTDHLSGGFGRLDLLGEEQGPPILAREHLDRIGEAESHAGALVRDGVDVAGHGPEELVPADLGGDARHGEHFELGDLRVAHLSERDGGDAEVRPAGVHDDDRRVARQILFRADVGGQHGQRALLARQALVHLIEEGIAGLLDADVPVVHALVAEELFDPASWISHGKPSLDFLFAIYDLRFVAAAGGFGTRRGSQIVNRP